MNNKKNSDYKIENKKEIQFVPFLFLVLLRTADW